MLLLSRGPQASMQQQTNKQTNKRRGTTTQSVKVNNSIARKKEAYTSKPCCNLLKALRRFVWYTAHLKKVKSHRPPTVTQDVRAHALTHTLTLQGTERTWQHTHTYAGPPACNGRRRRRHFWKEKKKKQWLDPHWPLCKHSVTVEYIRTSCFPSCLSSGPANTHTHAVWFLLLLLGLFGSR